MNRDERIRVRNQKRNARADERQKTIAEVLELIDKRIDLMDGIAQDSPNDLCRYTAGATANDFRILRAQIVVELKGETE